MKRLMTLLIVAIFILSFTAVSFAADMPTRAGAEQSSSGGYPNGPIQKAERGFNNALFGWTEIPKRIVDLTKQRNNPIEGLLLGGFQGTCRAFARTASGLADVVTFPIGGYDKPAIIPDMPAAK